MTANITFESLDAFNDQLLALHSRLVSKGGTFWGFDPAIEVPAISRGMARRRLTEGEVRAAIDAEKGGWPPEYYRLVQAGLDAGSLAVGLEAKAEMAAEQLRCGTAVATSIMYPLLLFGLGQICLALHCSFAVPAMQAVIASNDLPRMPELEWFAAVGSWKYAWLTLFLLPTVICLLGCLAIVWGNTRASRVCSKWIGRYLKSYRLYVLSLASQLTASFLQNGKQKDQAISTAMRIVKSPYGGAESDTRTPEVKGALLGWALEQIPDSQQTISRLQLASELYRNGADVALQRGISIWSTVIRVVIGGGIILVLSLSIFLPFVRMLFHMASAYLGTPR
jgi:type II secretory pathway component PulF